MIYKIILAILEIMLTFAKVKLQMQVYLEKAVIKL